MQNSSHHAFNLYTPLQPIEPVPNWSWNKRIVASNRGSMELGGLLSGNTGHVLNTQSNLRRQMQRGLTMDTSFGTGHPGSIGNHDQYRMLQATAMNFSPMNQVQQAQLMQSNISPVSSHSPVETEAISPKIKSETPVKSFSCSTCEKAFARRSDLARHERIHSGVRPHRCDFPNCGKDFIQRSALTVHSRVHTGEKPHACEVCRKPFSDSSSLARHRRIHSGKRPYKCPYASCQKTFTRRTTLTRHQAHHAGAAEEPTTELDRKDSIPGHKRSVDDSYSDARSTRTSTTPSADEHHSISPTTDMPQMSLHQPSQDFQYMPQNQSIPPHIRNEYGVSLRHNPSLSTTSMSSFSNIPQTRPSITSNPSAYGPPQPLEPPTNGTASGGASPHLNAIGWGSPSHIGLPSPNPMDFGGYPDPTYGSQHMFFTNNGMRRPQSTEPEDWSLRSIRNPNNNFNNHHMNLNMTHDWSALAMSEIKQERAYAM